MHLASISSISSRFLEQKCVLIVQKIRCEQKVGKERFPILLSHLLISFFSQPKHASPKRLLCRLGRVCCAVILCIGILTSVVNLSEDSKCIYIVNQVCHLPPFNYFSLTLFFELSTPRNSSSKYNQQRPYLFCAKAMKTTGIQGDTEKWQNRCSVHAIGAGGVRGVRYVATAPPSPSILKSVQ